MSTLNPFLLSYQETGKYCERKQDFEKIKTLLKNEQTGIITGLKGIGKSNLLYRLETELTSGNNNINIFYISIYPVADIAGFICLLARQTLGRSSTDHLKRMREISNFFTHLRPVINYHPLSGKAELDFTLMEGYNAEHTIEQIFSFLDKQYKEILVIIDDVQQLGIRREITL